MNLLTGSLIKSIFLVGALLANMPADIRIGEGEPFVVVDDDSDEHYLLYIRFFTVPDEERASDQELWDSASDLNGMSDEEIAELAAEIRALETSALRREIYAKMQEARQWFTFVDIEHAQQMVIMRLAIIAKMRQLNTDHDIFFYGNPKDTDSPFWEPGPPGRALYFRQVDGTPYEAIVSIMDGSSSTDGECYGALWCCVWWGAAQALGEERFNELHPDPLDLGRTQTFSMHLMGVSERSASVFVPGDVLYIRNYNYAEAADNHRALVLNGALWRGENLIYIGDDEFAGLADNGFGTLPEWRETLRQKYNRDLADVISQVAEIEGVKFEEIGQTEDLRLKMPIESHYRTIPYRVAR